MIWRMEETAAIFETFLCLKESMDCSSSLRILILSSSEEEKVGSDELRLAGSPERNEHQENRPTPLGHA
jgi:hypothetical protein